MTKIIEVSRNNTRCDKDSVDDYVRLMNGISYACHRYDEYSEGYRNQVAVDFTVGCWMLGLDAIKVLRDFEFYRLIDPANDDEQPIDRIGRVLDYTDSFSWDWMIDPDSYLTYGDVDEYDDYIKVFFKLV